MQTKVYPKELLLLLCVGFLCFLGGIVNGLIGTGGGLFIMLSASVIGKLTESECDMYSLAMMCVLPLSLFSLLLYPEGSVDTYFALTMLIPASIGGFIGAKIKKALDVKYLSIIFACLTIYSGITMIIRA